MAAFTFGSFGDILTLTSVVIASVRSLNDSTGSVSDYQDFIQELGSLTEILELAVFQNQDLSTASAAATSEGTISTISPPVISAAIRSHIEQCRSLMETFRQNVKSYERGLNQGGPKGWWNKIVWAMWKKDQVMSFRAKLATHRQQIIALAVLSNTDKLSRIEAVIPRSVKFTLANSIELVDALGTRNFFHINYCSTWKMLDHMLKGRFDNAPGGRLVQRGAYELSCDNGRQIILPQEWVRVVRPGMVIEMSIILRQNNGFDRRICPICRYQNFNLKTTHGLIDCLGPGCNARFQISEQTYDELCQWEKSDDTYNSNLQESVGISHPSDHMSEDEELRHLRSVHLRLLRPDLDRPRICPFWLTSKRGCLFANTCNFIHADGLSSVRS